jgi:hypothetical protein
LELRKLITVVGVGAFLIVGCGTGSSEPEIKPYDAIDTAAWHAALVSAGANRNADMRSLYDVATRDCNATVDQLALQFTLTGARPDITRIGMTYACPSRSNKVDQALKSDQQTEDDFARICRTPPEKRTHDEQQMLDAVSPGACSGR